MDFDMASKYGIAFTKSRMFLAVAWAVAVCKAGQDWFNSNGRGYVGTKNKSK